MKVNIKGLVFTGFAAAILSANAMATDENVVTSKSFTEHTYQHKSTATSVGVTGGTWKSLTGGTYAGIDDTGDNVVVDLNSSQMTTSYTAGTPLTNNSTKLVTEGVVAQAIADAADIDNFVVDSIVDGVDSKAPSQNAVYDALALKQNASTAVTHTQDSAVGSATVPVYIDSTGAAQPTTLGSAATSNVSTGIADTDTGLTTGDQVHDYVAAQLADTSLVGRGDFTVSINGTSQTFNANQSGDTSLTVSGLEVASNKAEAIIESGVGSNIDDSTAYASTKAVYDYVQSVTGGTVIPKKATSMCTDSIPCALVYENSGAHWRTMATQSHAGGTLADYCDANNSCSVGSCTDSVCVEGA